MNILEKIILENLSRCFLQKQNKMPFKIGIHKSTSIIDYLHVGFKFYLLMVDDFLRKIWTFLLKANYNMKIDG